MWTWVVKYAPTWFGKHGFNRPLTYDVKINEINVGELAEKLAAWIREGKASEEGGKIVVNLASLGYNKLLGRGRISKPVKVIVPAASESAIRKIKEAGGEVVVLDNRED